MISQKISCDGIAVVIKFTQKERTDSRGIHHETSACDRRNLNEKLENGVCHCIEAARAGEAGRGFAVVAAEIGSLADNSSETANQIQTLCKDANKSIESVQECFEDIITFMESDVSGRFNEFASMTDQYEAVVNDIREVISSIHDKTTVFSESAANIREQINNVRMASNDNEQGVGEIIDKNDSTAQTADSIIKIADQNQTNVAAIKDIVDMFK